MAKKARADRLQASKAATPAAPVRLSDDPRRRRRIALATGGVLALAIAIVAIGTAMALGIVGGSSGEGVGNAATGTAVFPEKDHNHVTGTVRYDRTPPAGGPHNAAWLNCGVYTQPVPNEDAVHSLEHGAVWITYRPDLPAKDVSKLQQFVVTHYRGVQRHLILSPYQGLPSPIVASAWGAQLQLSDPSDPGLATFVSDYQAGAQGGEPNGECTGGIGTPVR